MATSDTADPPRETPQEAPMPADPGEAPLAPESPQPMDPTRDPQTPEIPQTTPPAEDPPPDPFDDGNFPV